MAEYEGNYHNVTQGFLFINSDPVKGLTMPPNLSRGIWQQVITKVPVAVSYEVRLGKLDLHAQTDRLKYAGC